MLSSGMHRKSLEAASQLQETDNDHEGEERTDSSEQQQIQAKQQMQQQTDLQSGGSMSEDQEDLRREIRREHRDDEQGFSSTRDTPTYPPMDKVGYKYL